MADSSGRSKFTYLSDPPVSTRPFSIIVDKDKCIGCGVCIKQCPCQTIEMVKRDAASEKQHPACQFNCPSGIDVRGYLKIISEGGSLGDAWNLITQANPMPAITGRVCPHPCETACNRSYLDSGVNVHSIERAIGDYGIENNLAFEKPDRKAKAKVAVVGSGPSGMSCAYQLAKAGYEVTVFEASNRPGGMLMYAIPKYRLPEAVVNAELGRIIDLGITMKYNTAVGRDISLDDLRNQFKAVYLAIGAQGSTALGVKGEDSPNVLTGLNFLKSLKEGTPVKIGKKVLVIGGGNTAVDAARAARRMGSEVSILYRRTITEMPAYAQEVEAAQQEGIAIEYLCSPVKIEWNGKGSATCQRMELGKPDKSGRPAPVPIKGSEFSLPFDTLIAAVGQDINAAGFESLMGKTSWISVDTFGQTGLKGIFAGGDAATGPGMVTEAIGAGRRAALAIDAFIQGKKPETPEFKEISYKDIPMNDLKKMARSEAKELGIEQRLASMDAEVILPLGQAETLIEGKRCLGCGLSEPKFSGQQYFGKICIACHNCEAICPQGALAFPHFYRVDKGRWVYDFDYPAERGAGLPNPLGLEKPKPLSEIDSELTETEKVIYSRRSTRVYKPDKLPRELINRVLEAGRFAPSAGNCQGWKFVVCTDQQLLKELSESTIKFLGLFTKLYQGKGPMRTAVKDLLAFAKPNAADQRPMCAIQALMTPKFGDGNLNVFFNAPAVIFLLSHRFHISEPELGMGICGQNMALAAHSLGLGTCYVGFASNALNMDLSTKKKFRSRLGIEYPYDHVSTCLCIGYPAVKVDRPVDRESPKVVWVE